MPTTFATELDRLIRKHLGVPQWGDDFLPIVEALGEASDWVAEEADRFRWHDESEREFRERRQAAYAGRFH